MARKSTAPIIALYSQDRDSDPFVTRNVVVFDNIGMLERVTQTLGKLSKVPSSKESRQIPSMIVVSYVIHENLRKYCLIYGDSNEERRYTQKGADRLRDR